MKRFIFHSILYVALLLLLASTAHAGPPDDDSWEESLTEIQGIHKELTTPTGVSTRLFNPAMDGQTSFRTMDGSVEFEAGFLCETKNPIVQVVASSSGNGELRVAISYDPSGQGNLNRQLIINNVAGACSGGAVYDCQPSGSWSGCQYGLLEFKNSQLVISSKLPSGHDRPAMGMEGCFCFSDHCGGTASENMHSILTHIGHKVAEQIAAAHGNLVLSEAMISQQTQSAIWYAGDISNCQMSSTSNLTSQYGNLELNYQDVINTQEEGSPWDLVTKSLERKTDQFVCTQQAKVSSSFGLVNRSIPTKYYIGWDTDGSSKQCFWMSETYACGTAWAEPSSWAGCIEASSSRKAEICNSLWVTSGYFVSITDVTNDREAAPVLGMWQLGSHVSCYGAGDQDGSRNDLAQEWAMDCWGMRNSDIFECFSSEKTEPGQVIYNHPYNPLLYDGCDVVKPVEDSCASLAARSDCRLIKEVVDGAITVMNGAVTNARPISSCRTIKGAMETRTVCEPWWKKERTYECSDTVDDFDKERRRNQYIGQNINIDDSNRLSSVGDLFFPPSGGEYQRVIDADLQFDVMSNACDPACVVQKEVPNYELILPGQGKIESDGSYHIGDEKEKSIVPQGTRTILETVDCVLDNNQYICPVPSGWQLRAQCSCADGQEFIHAITSLTTINELSKDFICSTGNETGVCSAEDEGLDVHPVVCGDFPALPDLEKANAGMVLGVNYWECSPKLWKGITVSDQTHQVTVDNGYRCLAGRNESSVGDLFSLGLLTPVPTWFSPLLDWAKDEIIAYMSQQGQELLTGNKCDCPGFDYEVDICQPVGGEHMCLSTGSTHSSKEACTAVCPGRATESAEKGLCIWKDTALAPDNLSPVYSLALQPQNSKVFGEVLFNAVFNDSVIRADAFPECVDESYDPGYDTLENQWECETFVETVKIYGDPICWSYDDSSWFDWGRFIDGPCVGGVPQATRDASLARLRELTGYSSAKVILMGGIVVHENAWIDLLNPGVNSSNRVVSNGVGSFNVSWSADLWGRGIFEPVHSYVPTSGEAESGGALTYLYRQDAEISVRLSRCPYNNITYRNLNECTQACRRTQIQCKESGNIVDDPRQCFISKYTCKPGEVSFSLPEQCAAACIFTGPKNAQECANKSSEEQFSLFLTPSSGSFGFDAKLTTQRNSIDQSVVNSRAYGHESLILQQCADRYLNPYINYDEPGTGVHFEFSLFDAVAYEYAYKAGILPHENGELPNLPAVYRGFTMRLQHVKQMKLWEDSITEDGTVLQVPNTSLTDEERAALAFERPGLEMSEDGEWLNSLEEQQALIPKAPMFLEKTLNIMPGSPERIGRVGLARYAATALTPYVYYYECPSGVVNDTNQCGQKYPFGGVADTIAGKKCFQYFCDENATVENTTTQYSGCGLTNDGLITP